MKTRSLLILLWVFAIPAVASVPTAKLYPFPGFDLTAVRTKAKAESEPNIPELNEAWRLYEELRGSWMPDAPKPKPATVAQYDRLRAKLEATPRPAWYVDPAGSPGFRPAQLPEKIGDENFEKQRATPEYQRQKARALIYLTGHELDRPGDANVAGKCLTILALTHPWDWQVHDLYSRFLIDAQLPAPGWQAARYGLFLNPDPDLNDLKFFAFIGSIAAKEKWPEIQQAIRQAALDDKVAELAIVEMEKAYTENASVTIVPPKGK